MEIFSRRVKIKITNIENYQPDETYDIITAVFLMGYFVDPLDVLIQL